MRTRANGLLLALGLTACVTVASRTAPAPVAPAPPVPVPGFVRYPEMEAAHVKNIHDYRGKPVCQVCHVMDSERLLEGAGCERCHRVPHSKGHEVGTPLVRKDPVGLPLVKGLVACHTCHDPHDVKRERYGLRKNLNALCRDCHRNY